MRAGRENASSAHHPGVKIHDRTTRNSLGRKSQTLLVLECLLCEESAVVWSMDMGCGRRCR